MITFERKYPNVDLGLIPSFVSENDPRPAAQQINERYSFGGGWHPLKGFKLLEDGRIQYPDDPPLEILAEAKFRDEIIRFYPYAWVAIIQPDGSFEVSRLD